MPKPSGVPSTSVILICVGQAIVRPEMPGADRGAARKLARRDPTLPGDGLGDRDAGLQIRLGLAEGVIANKGRPRGRHPASLHEAPQRM